MFKQKDYQYFELAKKNIEEYVIQPGDEVTLQVYSRDGFKLIDVLGGATHSQQGSNSTVASTAGRVTDIQYLVDQEGFVKFPVLGIMYVKGYTQSELEAQLAQRYASLFVNPFVVLRVANRRVFLFKGDMGMVIKLNDAPTNLVEVLAKAGGLERLLKAYKIKIIRGDLANPQVRIVDLSTLEGLRSADLIVQSNDIIYIEQRKSVITDFTREILPVITPVISLIGLVTSFTLLARTIK
ncbi:MAG: polysaccharide biosynthesis/export family protein [Bacteroidetes bacterium]|nr:polysaccharide biosynthesis/export family protein [Bacteroidota bacterium]